MNRSNQNRPTVRRLPLPVPGYRGPASTDSGVVFSLNAGQDNAGTGKSQGMDGLLWLLN
jgi:hypothetical protein